MVANRVSAQDAIVGELGGLGPARGKVANRERKVDVCPITGRSADRVHVLDGQHWASCKDSHAESVAIENVVRSLGADRPDDLLGRGRRPNAVVELRPIVVVLGICAPVHRDTRMPAILSGSFDEGGSAASQGEARELTEF